MKIRKDLRSMPGELSPELLGDAGLAEMGTQDSAEMGTQGLGFRKPDAEGTAAANSSPADLDVASQGSGAAQAGFRFGPTPKLTQAEPHSPAGAHPATRAPAVEPAPPLDVARPSFSFGARTPATMPNADDVLGRDHAPVHGHAAGSQESKELPQSERGESADLSDDPESYEMPPAFESDVDAVVESTSPRPARFDARAAARGNAAAPKYPGHRPSSGKDSDEFCGIPGSAFIGFPADLPIGTAYSRAVWARASRQAGQDNAVIEIRTAHGGSALVIAARHQSIETHGGSATPWIDIDRALLIEVRHRSHAEQGYRNVKVGTGGFHKEMGTVEVDRPDLSALRRELGGATDRVLYATVQIAANPRSDEANGQVEREFWVVLSEDNVRRLAARGRRQQTEPRHRVLGLWSNGILARDLAGRPELRLADENAGFLALPPVAAPDPEPGSALDAKWTDAEGDFVVDAVERLLANGIPAIQAEEAGIWALYEHRRLKLGLPESARLAYLVEPSCPEECRTVEPAPPTEPCESASEIADAQGDAEGGAVATEPTRGARFGFGVRPRA